MLMVIILDQLILDPVPHGLSKPAPLATSKYLREDDQGVGGNGAGGCGMIAVMLWGSGPVCVTVRPAMISEGWRESTRLDLNNERQLSLSSWKSLMIFFIFLFKYL